MNSRANISLAVAAIVTAYFACNYISAAAEPITKDEVVAMVQKAVAALWAIGTEEAAQALLNCANESAVGLPLRQAALRAMARLELPTARQALEDFVRTTSDQALAAEGRKLLGA